MGRRLYSLFEKRGTKWVRISTNALFKESAVRHWQGQLLSGYFEGKRLELRPLTKAQLAAHEAAIDSAVVKAEAIVEGP
jgi:hypothetical protein